MTHPSVVSDLHRYRDLLKSAIAAVHDPGRTRTSHSDQSDWARQVRAVVDDPLAGLVIESAMLQKKAREKLGDGIWWCTTRSLAQATPHQVADFKARLIGEGLPAGTLVDLCCGIGADTMAMARSQRKSTQQIQAVDRDPIMVAITNENVNGNLCGSDTENSDAKNSDAVNVDVMCSDVIDCDLDASLALHIDPDRRDDRGRKTRPQDYSPNWEVVEAIISRCRAALVKLAPAAEIDDLPGRHRLWISLAGSVREQTLLAGGMMEQASQVLGFELTGAGRTAVNLRTDGAMSVFHGSLDDDAGPWIDQPLEWMADPDSAIRAAGLTASFAGCNGFQMLGGPTGFLTGRTEISGDSAICEPVIWAGACDDRKLRKTLRSLNCFPQRIKTRGVAQDPNVLEKKYRECGERPVTLWIGKGIRRQFAAITTYTA